MISLPHPCKRKRQRGKRCGGGNGVLGKVSVATGGTENFPIITKGGGGT